MNDGYSKAALKIIEVLSSGFPKDNAEKLLYFYLLLNNLERGHFDKDETDFIFDFIFYKLEELEDSADYIYRLICFFEEVFQNKSDKEIEFLPLQKLVNYPQLIRKEITVEDTQLSILGYSSGWVLKEGCSLYAYLFTHLNESYPELFITEAFLKFVALEHSTDFKQYCKEFILKHAAEYSRLSPPFSSSVRQVLEEILEEGEFNQ